MIRVDWFRLSFSSLKLFAHRTTAHPSIEALTDYCQETNYLPMPQSGDSGHPPGAHCQHLYGNRKSSNNRMKKMLRSTRSRGYLGSGLKDASSSTEAILLLLLLLPHQNASENAEEASDLSSHSLFALSLPLSLPASPTAPCPQEILHLSPHPRPLCSSAALCFRYTT